MNTNQAEEEAKFKINLTDYLLSTGTIKQGDFQFQFNPFKIYQLVCRRGGYQSVTNRKQWTQIASEFGTKNIQALKKFYKQFISNFQRKNYFGQQNQEELPTMILGLPRKQHKSDNNQKKPQQYGSLLSEITRSLQEQQQTKKLFYLQKNKLTITKAQAKKILLGLQPFMSRKDLVYSLNMLTLFSVNSHTSFLFQNYQKIFTNISNYFHSIYPPKNQQEMEDIRTITLIFRNLTMNSTNLKYILGTQIFSTFVSMFNTSFDHECSKNIVDIMSGLVKVGWDCKTILKQLNDAVLDDKIEDIQAGVQMLRSLIDQRQQSLPQAIIKNTKPLIRVLLSTQVSIQIKQQVFQILAFVTDISSQSRQQFLKNDSLLSIIIGILQHMKNHQKLVQFAALTLSNMTSSSSTKAQLKKYESDLMMIGFSDDSLAGIISNILTQLSH